LIHSQANPDGKHTDAADEKEGEEDCQQSFGERLHGTDAHVSDGANDLGDHR